MSERLRARGVVAPEAVAAAAECLPSSLRAHRELAAGLAAAPDPLLAANRLAFLLAAGPGEEVLEREVLSRSGRLVALLRLLGGSSYLATLLAAEGPGWPEALAELFASGTRTRDHHLRALQEAGLVGAVSWPDLLRGLRLHARRAFLRIGGRDLLGHAVLEETMAELTALAEASLEVAYRCRRAVLAAELGDAVVVEGGAQRPLRFVVLGMGKLGGEELNFSSDIDLIYVYERDAALRGGRTAREFFIRLAEEITRALREVTSDGFVFRVDLRLRPEGANGPLANSVEAMVRYYEAWGQPWERAALIKARPVAGDLSLGQELLEELSPFIYRRFLDYGSLGELQALKARLDAALGRRPAPGQDVKLGRGGIREVEFFVQAHQLVHGGKEARLRHPGTLAVLRQLAASGYVPPDEVERLVAAYRFLRDVEHKLQIAEGRQTQVVPEEGAALEALARRLGFERGPRGEAGAVESFRRAYAQHAAAVRAAYDRLLHPPGDAPAELLALTEQLDREEQVIWRLQALGFRNPEKAYRDLKLLREGPPRAPASPRRQQALARLAPALLGDLGACPDPDRALGLLASFITEIGARTSFLHLLLENPPTRRLLVELFASSEYLSRSFLRHPELLDSLVRADVACVERDRRSLAAELEERLAAVSGDIEAELDVLRRLRTEEFLRIGINDIHGALASEAVARQLSDLAETCLAAALAIARRLATQRFGLTEPPPPGLAVLGLGKLGARELNYNSDLDLIFVYDPALGASWWARQPCGPHEFYTVLAQRLITVLQSPTREGIVYRVDTRLRPSGRSGPLVSSLPAFARYHAESSQIWERQALLKARVVFAPPPLRQRLERIIEEFVYGRGLKGSEVAEIARLRTRMERELAGDDEEEVNIKIGPGGRVDIEFLVQMLQLRYGRDYPRLRRRETLAALDALREVGILKASDHEALAAAARFLARLESGLRLEQGRAVEAIAREPERLAAVARRMGYTGPPSLAGERLLADHKAHAERVRGIYERWFSLAVGWED